MWTVANVFRVGSIDLRTVSDSELALRAKSHSWEVPSEECLSHVPEMNEQGHVIVGMNSLVFRSAGKLILLDTGLGDKC